jgi:phosphoglycolate phosphatase-like HAD superfamily hydrolase
MSNLLPKLVLIPLVDLVIADAKPIVSIFQSNFKSEQISCADWAIGELIGKPIQEVIHTMCHRSRANCSEDKILTLTKNITHQLNAYFGTNTNNAHTKEVDIFLHSLQGKGIKVGLTSWLSKETTQIALKAANLLDRIDCFSHFSAGYHHGTSPDIIFTLMRQMGISNNEHVANLGKSKYDALRGYHAQCKWNILIAEDKENVRWNAYPNTAIVGSLREATAEILSKSGGSDFFKILNNKNRKRGK